jgi:hypothetical protein
MELLLFELMSMVCTREIISCNLPSAAITELGMKILDGQSDEVILNFYFRIGPIVGFSQHQDETWASFKAGDFFTAE